MNVFIQIEALIPYKSFSASFPVAGIHHSGLLPILKEVIEILFQEGLVKVRSEIKLVQVLSCEDNTLRDAYVLCVRATVYTNAR